MVEIFNHSVRTSVEYITTTRGSWRYVKLRTDVDDFFFPYQTSLPQLSSQFCIQVPDWSGVRGIIFNILNDREVKLIVNVANYLDTVLL